MTQQTMPEKPANRERRPIAFRWFLGLFLTLLTGCYYGDPGFGTLDPMPGPNSRDPRHLRPVDPRTLPLPETNMGRLVATPQSRTTRYGNKIVVPGESRSGEPFSKFNPSQLLQVDLDEIDQSELYKAGSWVLSVSSEVIYSSDVSDTPIAPLVARILLGSGSAIEVIEVDAVPGFTVSLPAGSIVCSLFWDNLPTELGGAGVTDYVPPVEVRVTGILQRSFAETSAHRSFLIGRGDPLAPTTDGVVPRHAVEWQLYSTSASNIYGAGDLVVLYEGPAGGGSELQRITGAQALAAVQAGNVFKVPSYASFWSVAPQDILTHLTRISFTLDL